MSEIIASRHSVTEGISTAKAAKFLADHNNLDMPIVEAVYNCLYNNLPVQEAVTSILSRPARQEGE